jgi:hypothetical protein
MSDRGNYNRRIRQGIVDVDYEDSALVVNYEVETVRSDLLLIYMSCVVTSFLLRLKWTKEQVR